MQSLYFKHMSFPYTIIDLTHTLSEDVPTWDARCTFEHTINCDYDPNSQYKFRAHVIQMAESIGTHMDAPAHCIPGGATIEQLSLDHLIAPCVVIDVSAKSHERYTIMPADVEAFEQTHDRIPAGSCVLFRTGWEQYWGQPDKYRNNHVFPCLSEQVAHLLLERNIAGIGIDTLSPDRPEHGFPVHQAILGAGKYIVENVANSGVLPPVGAYTLCLPIKTRGGTEAPVRLVGLI
jgi:kynurenine formamidase